MKFDEEIDSIKNLLTGVMLFQKEKHFEYTRIFFSRRIAHSSILVIMIENIRTLGVNLDS
jgi:hypothetical protein